MRCLWQPRKLRFIYQNRKKGIGWTRDPWREWGGWTGASVPGDTPAEGMAQDLAVSADAGRDGENASAAGEPRARSGEGEREPVRKCSTRRFVEKTGEQLRRA